MEIVFSVTQEADGGYVAECLSHDIFTQGDKWEQVRANVRSNRINSDELRLFAFNANRIPQRPPESVQFDFHHVTVV